MRKGRRSTMQPMLIRIEMPDDEAWLKTHDEHAADRQSYAIIDGPLYRDIDTPHAALFRISTENLDRAMQWFGSETFKQAIRRATVTGREFYLAQKRETSTNTP
jgi:hypothetical protein